MKENLRLVYRHVPPELVSDFNKLSSSDIIIKEDPLDYFSGGPSDIVLYINEHYTELLTTSLLAPAAYDLLKTTISAVWKKVINYYKKKSRPLEKEYNCLKIELDINSERKMEFRLDGDIDPQIVNEVSEKLFNYLQNQEFQKTAFENQKIVAKDTLKPTIRIRYDKLKEKWEPVENRTDNNSSKLNFQDFDS